LDVHLFLIAINLLLPYAVYKRATFHRADSGHITDIGIPHDLYCYADNGKIVS